jgi:hypothetical protein
LRDFQFSTVAIAVPEAKEAKDKEEKAEKAEMSVPKAERKTLRVSRRLSARVGDFFKPKPKVEVTTPRVDEHPPLIRKPDPIAPLENPESKTLKASHCLSA